MRMFSTLIKIFLLLGYLFVLTGCTATIAREYGYSFSESISASRWQDVSCGEMKYYFSNPPNYKIDLSNSDASVIITLDDSQKVHWISLGPGVLVPLPLIPWPFGILSAMAESENPNAEKIEVYLHVQTYKENFSVNPYLMKLRIGSDLLSPLEVTQYVKDNRIILYSPIQINNSEYISVPIRKSQAFNIVFHIPKPGPTEIELIPNGFMLNEAEIHFAPLKLYFFRGTRLYWLTTINC